LYLKKTDNGPLKEKFTGAWPAFKEGGGRKDERTDVSRDLKK